MRRRSFTTRQASSWLSGFLLLAAGCGKSVEPDAIAKADQETAHQIAGEKAIEKFCSGCHGAPRPSSFPKEAWPEEVEQGFDLFLDSDRTDLKPVRPVSLVIDYYRDRAPDRFQFSDFGNVATPPPVTFRQQGLELAPGSDPVVVSHIRMTPQTQAHGPGLLVSDMEHGRLIWTDPLAPDAPDQVLETFHHPAGVTVFDLNDDDQLDYVVADLGSFLPEDHQKGKVYLLSRDRDGQWNKQILLTRVGRVVDVEPGDFDGDSRIDLVVSEFGWRKTGSIRLLRNVSDSANEVQFQSQQLDPRAGAIQVQKCDLNQDGHLDFVTVFSQEHEAVVAFLNDGNGAFDTRTIWEAGFPSYGSSGIELVDMDRDGDLDVLYTNGDSFDDFLIKPHHSIQWLENRNSYPFIHHELTKMPGVHRALAGDLDGDDDLDVVAVAMLPNESRGTASSRNLDSVVLLEQVAPGDFVRHSLEKGTLDHACFEMGDFDGDTDLDFAVGVFLQKQNKARINVWWNQRVDSAESP